MSVRTTAIRIFASRPGGIRVKTGSYAEALEYFSKCIELEPEDHIHWPALLLGYSNRKPATYSRT